MLLQVYESRASLKLTKTSSSRIYFTIVKIATQAFGANGFLQNRNIERYVAKSLH